MGRDTSGLIVIGLSVVMILVGGVMSYQAHDRNEGYKAEMTKWDEKINKQLKDVANYEGRVVELSKAMGWARVSPVSRPEAVKSTMDHYLSWLKKEGEGNPEWATKLNANDRIDLKTTMPWSESAKNEMGDFLTVDKGIRAMKSLEAYLTGLTEGIIKERDDARAEEDKLIGERGLEAVKEKEIKEKISGQRKENEQLMTNIKNQSSTKKGEINELDHRIQDAIEKLADIRAKNEELVVLAKAELDKVKERINNFNQRAELARSSTEADGRVTHAVPDQNYAWIDVGSRHTLLVGTRFEVFGLEKGGLKVPKGEVEVLKVWEDHSQVSIVKTLNSTRPIEAGDYINNEIFDRNKTKVFAFAGRFVGKYSNEEAKKKIEEIGGAVTEVATLETAYVVVGTGFETDPNYQRALEWGIIIIREKDLYDLMGIR